MIFLISILLLAISFQDLKDRAISIGLFIALFIMVCLYFYSFIQINWLEIIQNILFLVLQLAVITLYFLVVKRQRISAFEDYLGLGDVVMWVILALSFSTLNFVLFFTLSSIISLLLGFTLFKNKSIPFAGIQALGFMSYLIGVELHFLPHSFNSYWQWK